MDAVIPLSGPAGRGLVVIVDDVDVPVVARFAWFAARRGTNVYANANLPRQGARPRAVYMHRLLMPGARYVDHVNGNGLDNRRANIRACSNAQNAANARVSSASKSGYKGVGWHRRAGKWRAYIFHNGSALHLGLFADVRDAACAYDEAASRLFGPFARLNLPSTR